MPSTFVIVVHETAHLKLRHSPRSLVSGSSDQLARHQSRITQCGPGTSGSACSTKLTWKLHQLTRILGSQLWSLSQLHIRVAPPHMSIVVRLHLPLHAQSAAPWRSEAVPLDTCPLGLHHVGRIIRFSAKINHHVHHHFPNAVNSIE